MKKLIVLMVILITFGFAYSQAPKKATYINKLGEIMITQDGGVTWHIANKPYQKYYRIDNNFNSVEINSVINNESQTAIFIKNGAKITHDGGRTWENLSSEDMKSVKTKDEILLYPNPVSGEYVNISLSSLNGNQQATAYVYDLLGREVLTESLLLKSGNSANFSLNVSVLQNGQYLLKLINGNGQYITNLTIER